MLAKCAAIAGIATGKARAAAVLHPSTAATQNMNRQVARASAASAALKRAGGVLASQGANVREKSPRLCRRACTCRQLALLPFSFACQRTPASGSPSGALRLAALQYTHTSGTQSRLGAAPGFHAKQAQLHSSRGAGSKCAHPYPLASGEHCSTPASSTQGSSHHALHLYGRNYHALHTFPPLGALHHGLHVGLGVLHVGDLQPELVHHHLGERKKGKWHSTAQRRNSARATPGPGHRCLLPRCRGTVPIAGKAQQGALGTAVALQLQHCTDPSPGAASCPPGGPRG